MAITEPCHSAAHDGGGQPGHCYYFFVEHGPNRYESSSPSKLSFSREMHNRDTFILNSSCCSDKYFLDNDSGAGRLSKAPGCPAQRAFADSLDGIKLQVLQVEENYLNK